MSVEIDPVELGFHRPFTNEIAQVLKIRNVNAAPIAFKVKTTAPKQYCVRPNSGRIEPGHNVEVSVLLQAMKQEPPPDARCRDKFLVQSVTITGDKEFTNVAQIWETVDRSTIQEKKIRVTWLPPVENGASAEKITTPVRQSVANGVDGTPNMPPPAYSSPTEESNTRATTAEPEPAANETTIADEPEPAPPVIATATSVVESSIASLKDAAENRYEDLKEQLAKAQATIVSLKNEAAGELRQRKPQVAAPSGATAGSSPEQLAQAVRQGTEGVPIQIVAVLCLTSFLLAYFFF